MVKVDDDLVRIGVDRTEEEEKARLHAAAHHERECVAEQPGRQEGEGSMHSPLDFGLQLAPAARLAHALVPCHRLLSAACRRLTLAAEACSCAIAGLLPTAVPPVAAGS